MRDRNPFALAGLWEIWEGPDRLRVDSFTIITTTPNDLMRTIHDRMPVILHSINYSTWLDPAIQESERLLPLLCSFPEENMEAIAVGSEVNNPRNDTPRCLEPVSPDSDFPLLDLS